MKLKKNSIICLAGMSQKKNCSCGSAFGLISLIVNTESKFSLGFFQWMVFIDMLDNYKQFHNGGREHLVLYWAKITNYFTIRPCSGEP